MKVVGIKVGVKVVGIKVGVKVVGIKVGVNKRKVIYKIIIIFSCSLELVVDGYLFFTSLFYFILFTGLRGYFRFNRH